MTTQDYYNIVPDENGWRILPNGNKFKLGLGCIIGKYASIGDGAQIGYRAIIGNAAKIGNGAYIENNVILRNNEKQ